MINQGLKFRGKTQAAWGACLLLLKDWDVHLGYRLGENKAGPGLLNDVAKL